MGERGKVEELGTLLSNTQNNYSTIHDGHHSDEGKEKSSPRIPTPKSILSQNEKKGERLRREVSWNDLSGLPLEEIYQVPGTAESELRGSMAKFEVKKSNRPNYASLLFLLFFLIVLLAAVVLFAVYF